jgi:signal transduction histidine kinase
MYKKDQKIKLDRMIENEKELSVKAVADAEENERKRIAADLHDNLGAYAASIASNLDIFNAEDLNEQHKNALQELNNNSQSMVSQLSDTIWALNKDNLTLTAISDRVKVFLNRIRKSYGNIDMEVVENIRQDAELPTTQAFHLFRIIQEAVTNAVKHSGTTRITILVEEDPAWKITVTDYGKGMKNEINGEGNGLRNMKARAAASGWSIIWSENEVSGTKVIIQPGVN